MRLNREKCYKVIQWEILAANDQIDKRLMFLKNFASVGCLPLPRGYIHVYMIIIFKISKPLGLSKPKFMCSLLGKRKINLCKWSGHMTKVAAMPIYGQIFKNLRNQKYLDLETCHGPSRTQDLQSFYNWQVVNNMIFLESVVPFFLESFVPFFLESFVPFLLCFWNDLLFVYVRVILPLMDMGRSG